MSVLDAVIFDMDGVLVFSEEAWFRVYNDTLVHFGHAPISREAFDDIYGSGTEADRDTYMPERSVAEVDEAYRRFFVERHLASVVPNEEARDVLHELRRLGVPAAVATNTNRPLAERVLDAVGLRPLLSVMACADEAGAGKPDPAVLHLAAGRLGVPLSRSLFVGDSRYDAGAAEAAPVRFAGYHLPPGVPGSFTRLSTLRDILTIDEPAVAPAQQTTASWR